MNLGIGTVRVTLIHGERCLEGKKPDEERLQIRPESAKIDGGSGRDGHGSHSRRLGRWGEQGDGEKREKSSQPDPLYRENRRVGNFRVKFGPENSD